MNARVGRKMGDYRRAIFLNSLRSQLEERRDHSVPVRLGGDSQRDPVHGEAGPIDSERKDSVTQPIGSRRNDSVTRRGTL